MSGIDIRRYYKIHPDSPCLRCKWFVNRWCTLEILDRNLAPLLEGKPCKCFEPKEEMSV